MSEFIQFREKQYINPCIIENKEQYHMDLLNIEHSWTGRMDAQIANTFILESNQLLINSISLFEMGYFDCAFYSLRQSLEVSTIMIYLIDNDVNKREDIFNNWQRQSPFPMYGKMMNFLEQNKLVFEDMKSKMSEYFKDLNSIKSKLNKYVHKQGFQTFYISRNHPFNRHRADDRLPQQFETYLKKCIGAVAVFRLAIDPFPILLMDDEMYSRTGDSMTKGYGEEFIEKYIGFEHVEAYKRTEIYLNHYNGIILEEAKAPCVSSVIKNHYIDKVLIDKILEQKHLLPVNDLNAVNLCSFSEKICKIYSIGGFLMYFTNIDTVRTNLSWSGEDFMKVKENSNSINQNFDEAFISFVAIDNEDYWIEHNDLLENNEIKIIMDYALVGADF